MYEENQDIVNAGNNKLNAKKTAKADGTHFQHSKVDKIFNLVRINGKVRIVIGDNVVSIKEFKNFAQADKYVAEKPYEILINTACLIVNTLIKNENKDKENAKVTESSKANK